MAEELQQEDVQVNTDFDPITSPEVADDTQHQLDVNAQFAKPSYEQPEDNYSDIEFQNQLDDIGLEKDEIDSYERETGLELVDYEALDSNTIKNTGTGLDGKTVEEVATAKDATPNEIWDTKDVLEQACLGIYECVRSISKIGAWTTATGVELFTGVPVTDEEMLKGNPLDYGESPEAKSLAGTLAKGGVQIAGGGAAVKGLSLLTKAPKAAEGITALAKSNFGKKVIAGTLNFLKGLSIEFVSFDENQANFSEMLKSFGVTEKELLSKNPNDSFFAKKLKNSVDGGAVNLILNTLVGSAKMFAKRAKAKPVIEEGAKTAEEIKSAVSKGNMIEPSKETLEFGERTNKLNLTKQTEVAEIAEDVKNTAKGLSEKEKEAIYKKVKMELSDDDSIENAMKIANEDMKNVNKAQFENVVLNKEREIIEGKKIAEESKAFLEPMASGDKNEKQIAEFARDKFMGLINNRKATIEAVSPASQSMAEVSKSMVARRVNRLAQFVQDNADKIDNRKLIKIMASLDTPQDFDNFFNIADEAVKHGKVREFFEKLTFVRQNIMLLSGTSTVKDIASTLTHRISEYADIATAVGVKYVEKGVGKAKSVFKKPDETAAKIRLGLGDVDNVELKEIVDNVVGMGDYFAEMFKNGYRNTVSKHIKQVGQGLSKFNAMKDTNYKIVPGNNAFSNTANTVINHSGIFIQEAKDDAITAMMHAGDVRQNVGSYVRRLIRQGMPEEEAVEKGKQLLKSAESWTGSSSQKIFDFADGLTDEMVLDSIMKRAASSATRTTFRDPLTGGTKDLYNVINRIPVVRETLRLVAPFQKTGLTIAIERGIKERTAFALLNPKFWNSVSKGGREKQMAIARLVNGLAVQGTAGVMMMNGQMVGRFPKDRGEREQMQGAGALEYSIKIGDKYYSMIDLAGPNGPLIKTALDFATDIKDMAIEREKNPDKDVDYAQAILSSAAHLGIEYPLSPTMFGGILENAERGDVMGVKNILRSFVTGPRVINEAQSAYNRFHEYFGVGPEIAEHSRYRKAPISYGERAAVSVGAEGHYRRDIFGSPIKAAELSWAGMMSSKDSSDVVTREMAERMAWVEPPSNTMSVKGKTIPLDDEEKDLWYQEMENIGTWNEMRDFISTKVYKDLTLNEKTKALKQKYNELKRKAAENLLDKDAIIGLKYKRAVDSEDIPTINEDPNWTTVLGE